MTRPKKAKAKPCWTPQTSCSKHSKEYGDQYEATEALNLAQSSANEEYKKFVKIAHVALNSDYAVIK